MCTKHCKLSCSDHLELMKYFVAGATARTAGNLVGIHRNTLREKIEPDSIVYTDCWRGYNALEVYEFKHFRINHSALFAEKHNHIHGIENFWNQAKRHMKKFNDIPRQHFNLFLKECKWRFNMGAPKELIKDLKKLLKENF